MALQHQLASWGGGGAGDEKDNGGGGGGGMEGGWELSPLSKVMMSYMAVGVVVFS